MGCIIISIEMWYDKSPSHFMGRDYVREVTKWPGHTRVTHIPIEYS